MTSKPKDANLLQTPLPKILQKTLLFKCKNGTQLHGSCVAKNGKAILFIGKPGSGKSTCCWRLMQYGYKLIADDIVNLTKESFCTAPTETKGLLHLRQLGLLTINKKNLIAKAKLALVINLDN